jgi:hypothetical protein
MAENPTELMPPMPGEQWQLLPPDVQAITPILTCLNCGVTMRELNGTPNDLFPSQNCGDCPPWRCEDCGEMSSATDLCSCWISLEGMPLADIKALFAADGTFSVGGLGAHHREDGSEV